MKDLTAIENRHYLAEDQEVRQLAKQHFEASTGLGITKVTYLRILAAHVKHSAGRKLRTLKADKALEILEATHARLYAIVLDAVTTVEVADSDDLPKEERTRRSLVRNSRSGFARSSATSIRNYLRLGGALADIDPNTLKRSDLARPEPEEVTVPRQAERAAARAATAIIALAKLDRVAADALLQMIIMEVGPEVAKPLVRGRTKRGELTLHPHA